MTHGVRREVSHRCLLVIPAHGCSWPWFPLSQSHSALRNLIPVSFVTSMVRAGCRDQNLPTGIQAVTWHDTACIRQNQVPGAVRRTSPARFPDEIKVCLSSVSPLETTDQRDVVININLKLCWEAELTAKAAQALELICFCCLPHLRIG